MKRIFKIATIVISLFAAWWFISLLLLEDYYTSNAQSAYPPPLSDAPLTPYQPSPFPYPGPQVPQATPRSTPTNAPELASISIMISVEGMKDGDEAQVSMLPFTENVKSQVQITDTELPSIYLSGGDQTIIANDVPVGIYKLTIQAPPEYLRSPKGYIIRIQGETVEQSLDQHLRFNLVPSNETNLPPCRDFIINEMAGATTEIEDIPFAHQDVCMAEGLVDISNPIAMNGQLLSNPNSPDYGNYYYAGPKTIQNNQGVWGRNYVVNPSINHGIGYDQFVAERVYADNGSDWMEAGWIEKSWLDDRQYIYAMDSNAPESIVFDEYNIATGSEVETRVYYNSEIGKWRATYHLGGGSWAVLREETIGFSIADNGYNRAEFWENIGVLPLMPPSNFDKGYLLIDGIWRIWDTSYDTDLRIDFPYQLDMITQYNHFVIHSPITSLPLIMKY